jgi:hypothetical protein
MKFPSIERRDNHRLFGGTDVPLEFSGACVVEDARKIICAQRVARNRKRGGAVLVA